MSYDNTGRLPVLRGRIFWVLEVQTRLFFLQAGDPPPQDSLSYAFEEGGEDCVQEGYLKRSKVDPYVWVDPLHGCPLLL